VHPVTRRALAVAVVLAVLSTGCSVLGGGGGTYRVTAYFSRAVSVFPSSTVRVLGLPAGTVESVETEGDRVRIDLSINDDIRLPADVTAVIVPLSLIGERYVQLMPAWTEGDPRVEDGHVIELEDTIVPVEPDEALAALKEFLDSLDPDGVGRLIDNAATALEGNGRHLGQALDGLSELVTTFAEKDDQLVSIVENFDRFTQTLVTRERQLGEVLDLFSSASQVLADEREGLENLLASLARLSENGLDLVAKHAATLRTDVDTVTRLVRSVHTNLDAVAALLDSGPLLVGTPRTDEALSGRGLLGAYNPEARALDLRQNFDPAVAQALEAILGVELPCLPITSLCGPGIVPTAAGNPVALTSRPPTYARTPVSDVLDLLRRPTAAPAERESGSAAERVASGAGAVGGFVRDAFGSLLGVGS
jgi:phospholipid/cholesterol/gamma-HCH transport system substrate-binding protein